jgi:hypothetical protein
MLQNASLTLITAVTKVLRPMVRILLRNGIDYGTLAEVLRKVYVDVAAEELVEKGKRPTVSSVSAMTGLTRKEAKRLKDLDMPASQQTHQKYNRATRVISGWLNDKTYLDKNKNPAKLSIDEGNNSFFSLAKKYSGDIPPAAMLSVLKEAGVVELDGDSVVLIEHAYIPHGDSIEKIEILGSDASELICTIDHNLTAIKEDLYFQRKVSNCLVSDKTAEEFKKIATKKSQQLLEHLNHWLGEREITDPEEIEDANYVALGIYFSQKPTDGKVIGVSNESK